MQVDGEDNCALCLNVDKLCDSHIIPEFCYKPIYDDKHRLVTFEPTNPDDRGFEQKGVRSKLLCRECEGLINDRYEKPFRRYWFEGDALISLRTASVTVLRGVDYPSFKLFHLSVLFRASASDHPNFREVMLGEPHHERIRKMVLNGDPGEGWQYPIVCSAVEGPRGRIWDELIGPAHRVKLHGHWGYYFTFGGAQWIYIVSSHPAKEIERLSLTEYGELPVAKLPWRAVDHYRQERTTRSRG